MPPPAPAPPRSASLKVHTPASRKTTASAGKAYFSKAWTKLWPMKPITISAATTSSREGRGRRPVSVLRAKAALTLLTANQPTPATSAFTPEGSRLPRKPKEKRPIAICGTPKRGPSRDRIPWVSDPSAVPSRSAAVACQKFRPKKRTEITPM